MVKKLKKKKHFKNLISKKSLKFFGGGWIGSMIIGQFAGGFSDYPEAIACWKKKLNLN